MVESETPEHPSEEGGQRLAFRPMRPHVARIIADTWKYPAPFHFYDATADPEDYQEFVRPEEWPPFFQEVETHRELVGFFSASPMGDGVGWEISLGMRPDLTGSGRGLAFVLAGIAELSRCVCPGRVVLSVAAFNTRAISVYEAAGFVQTRTFQQETNGGTYEFLEMELRAGA